MKTCPICKARCFDDMEICYGCMHRFEDDERVIPVDDAVGAAKDPEVRVASRVPEPVASGGEVARKGDPMAKRVQRREAPRVFGAMEEDDPFEMPEDISDSRTARMPFALVESLGSGADMPQLELMTGPIAVAPLGGGYRLVVSIERV